ncbi:preprotein translocase subunit SecG [candidate division KSB1 bacterium 4572_119]|nr:MAG: preprotein translocase subunit SecG [candidate division KSB1 bacterium 4572_119]
METFLIIIHFIITVLLMVVILLQSSKGGGLAGVFGGGGGMGTVFGGRGAASFLQKATTILAAVFLGLALLISYIDKGKALDQSVVAEEIERRRASSSAAVLPTVPTGEATTGQTIPMTTPTSGDSGK